MRQRTLKIALWVMAGGVALILVAACLLLWRLATTPLQIGFLTPVLEQTLSNALPGRRIDAGDTALAWDRTTQDLDVRAHTVTIRDRHGTLLAILPKADVSFSINALLHGSMALTAIRLEGANVTLTRRQDGVLLFGVDEERAVHQPPADWNQWHEVSKRLLETLGHLLTILMSEPVPAKPMTYLREIQVRNATLKVRDQNRETVWHIPKTELLLHHTRSGLSGRLHVTVATPDHPTDIDATVTYNPQTERFDLDVAFVNMRPSVVAALLPMQGDLDGMQLPFAGDAAFSVDSQGRLQRLSFAATGGPGKLSHARLLPEGRSISTVEVRGHLHGVDGTLHVDHLSAAFGNRDQPGPALVASGTLEAIAHDVAIKAQAALQILSIADLQVYWPAEVSPRARTWVVEHLKSGTVQQATAEAVWRMPMTDMSNVTVEALKGTLHYRLDGKDAAEGIDAELSYDPMHPTLNVKIDIIDLRPSSLATAMPALQQMAGLDVPFNGFLNLSYDLRHKFPDLTFELSGGPGHLSLPNGLSVSRPVAAIATRGRLDGQRATLHVDDIAITFGTTAATGPIFHLNLMAQALRETLKVESHTTLQAFQIADLNAYWPLGILQGTRKWLTENLTVGTVPEASLTLAMTLPQSAAHQVKIDRLDGTLRYQNCEVHYLRPLPPVTGVKGTAHFNRQGFLILVEEGIGPGMQITGGQVEITGLDMGRDAIAIQVEVDSPIQAALQLLDHPRLNLLSGLGIKPTSTGGHATSRVVLAFSLRGDIDVKDIDIQASGTLEEVSIEKMLLGQDVDHGQLDLSLDARGMTLRGTARFAAVPLTLTWKEAFTRESPWRSQIHAVIPRIWQADLRRFGVDTQHLVEGPLTASLIATIGHEGRGKVNADVNLRQAELAVPVIGWRKAIGAPGEIRGSLQIDPQQAMVQSDFVVEAGNLTTRGSGRFSIASGSLTDLELSNLIFNNSHFSTVSVRQDDTGFDITLGEGVLDAKGILSLRVDEKRASPEVKTESPASEPAATKKAKRIHLHAPALRQVHFGPDHYLEDVKATLVYGATGWEFIEMTGKVPPARVIPVSTGAQPKQTAAPSAGMFSVTYRPSPPPREIYDLSIHIDEVGATLYALNLLDSVRGGRLRLEGHTQDARPDGPVTTTLNVKNFTLKRAPILGRLLAAASFGGLADLLNNNGLTFSRLNAQFTLQDGVMDISLARARGGGLGLTAEGVLNILAGTAELKGTIIPVRGLNTLPGKIPLIGELLVGGKGQGLVAVTYHLEGKLSEPKIVVNPAAALTPGFLRGIFDLFGGIEAEPAEPPANPSDPERTD